MTTLPVVVNPTSRGGRSSPPREALERAARGLGYAVEWWETAAPGHAVELAARAARDRLSVLATWGGDGTYNEVARGLAGSSTAMLALPGGTSSVLAWELGIPRDPIEALTLQLGGERRAMQLGRTGSGQLFLLMLSVGPDSVILANLPPALKHYGGKVGVTVQAFVEFGRGHLPDFEVAVDGARMRASWCIVGNARHYGGPYRATPGADPFSPGFEVVSLHRHGRTAVVPFFFAIPSGRHLSMRGVTRRPGHEVVIEGDRDVPYQLDGDPAGTLPVTATTADETLVVLLPAARQARPGGYADGEHTSGIVKNA